MKQLKPRTILFLGLPGLFLAFFTPFAIFAESRQGVFVAFVGSILFTLCLGLPVFGVMAWAAVWSHRKPGGDLMALERRYRFVERYFALAGILSIGYMIGWVVNFPFHQLDSVETSRLWVSVTLLGVSFLGIFIAAIAKIGLLKRLEILKAEIEAAKPHANQNAEST